MSTPRVSSGMRLEVSKLGTSDKEAPSKVAQLFAKLGGEGKVKVFRIVDGDENYCKTFDVSEDFSANLEERLCSALGGGHFVLKGQHNGQYVGTASMHIDQLLHDPKLSDRERARRGDGPAAQNQDAAAPDVVGLYRELLRESKQGADSSSRQMTAMMGAMLQLQEANTNRLLSVLLAQRQESPAHSGLQAVKQTVDLMRTLGLDPGAKGEAGGNENLSFGERVLAAPLTKIGERVGDAIVEQMKGSRASSSSSSSSPPPAGNPNPNGPASAAAEPPSARPSVPRVPKGARILSPEEIAQQRANLGRAPHPAPRAPKVRDALPDAAAPPERKG